MVIDHGQLSRAPACVIPEQEAAKKYRWPDGAEVGSTAPARRRPVNKRSLREPRTLSLVNFIKTALSIALAVALVSLAHAGDRANVPLKNWGGFSLFRDAVYDDLERLVTAGLGGRVLLSTKPLSRIEAARMVGRAIEQIRSDEAQFWSLRRDLEPVLDRLMEEFRPELASLGVKVPHEAGSAPGFFSFLPVDRAQVRAGYASRDLSWVNSQGLRFQGGVNGGATFESRAQIGDFLTLYVQPEFQGNEEFAAGRLASGYAKLTLYNVELLVGRDSLWWGPGLHGSLIFSNNAPPLDQIRIGAAEPFLLPWIGEWVGPTKLLLFLAQLEERRDHKRAKLAGMRGTIAPFSFLELGISRAVQFDGRLVLARQQGIERALDAGRPRLGERGDPVGAGNVRGVGLGHRRSTTRPSIASIASRGETPGNSMR